MGDFDAVEDLIKMLDSGFEKGVGHVNVYSDNEQDPSKAAPQKEVQTMGCSDCSRTPLACSVPTLHDGLDDFK